MNHHDHFRCTITYGLCGKPRLYEDECHIKRRDSNKLKCEEAERHKKQFPSGNPKNGDKGGKGGDKGGGKRWHLSAPGVTPGPTAQKERIGGVARMEPPTIPPQNCASAPVASPAPTTADPKKRPQGENPSQEESNSKEEAIGLEDQIAHCCGGQGEIL